MSGDSSIVSGIRSASGAPANELMLRVRKRVSWGPVPRAEGLRARAVSEEELELSKRMIRDAEGGWEPWPEDVRLCMCNMPGLIGAAGSGDVSSPGMDDELAAEVDRCHGFGSREGLLSILRRWRLSADVSRGEDERGVERTRGDGRGAGKTRGEGR